MYTKYETTKWPHWVPPIKLLIDLHCVTTIKLNDPHCVPTIKLLNDLHCVPTIKLLNDLHCVTAIKLINDLNCVPPIKILSDLHCVPTILCNRWWTKLKDRKHVFQKKTFHGFPFDLRARHNLLASMLSSFCTHVTFVAASVDSAVTRVRILKITLTLLLYYLHYYLWSILHLQSCKTVALTENETYQNLV